MSKMSWIIGPILSIAVSIQVYAQEAPIELNIKTFGAKDDVEFNSTQAVQAAIDSAYFKGGGKVLVPNGDYLIGTIVLKSEVKLHLADSATLHASRNINDYRAPLQHAKRPVLIYANGALNVKITGHGKIDGHAEHVYEALREIDPIIEKETKLAQESGVEMSRFYIVKPDVNLITLVDCQGIEINSLTITNSSYWTLHLLNCEDVLMDGLDIRSSLAKGVNADGIDLNLCRNVVVKNCTVKTGDDAIVIKSRSDKLTENIRVSDCVVSSSSSALKIGTETRGTIRNVVFENCKVEDSNRGLSIVVMDGSEVSDVSFTNIEVECSRRHFNWWGDGDPIHIRLSKRRPKSKIGSIQNVVFENIVAKGVGTSMIVSDFPDRISDIRLKNVAMEIHSESVKDLRAGDAFYLKSIDKLMMEQVSIKWDTNQTQSTWQHTLVLDSVTNSEISNFRSAGFHGLKGSAHLKMVDVVNVGINHISTKPTSYAAIEMYEGGKLKGQFNLDGTKMLPSKNPKTFEDER